MTETGTSPGTALCLSGGGFRAMVFHVGALWRLNELGRLGRLSMVSSVSGGSIAAAVLGRHWNDLDFDERGVAGRFDLVADALLSFSKERVDLPVWARGMVTPSRPGGQLARTYERTLYGRATLGDLPTAPQFVICATNMATGDLVRFERTATDGPKQDDAANAVLLARAVAASSAFPPVFSPYRVALPLALRGTSDPAQDPDTDAWWSKLAPKWDWPSRALLGDGGIHDNLGLDPAMAYSTIYVSDAGIPFVGRRRVPADWLRQTLAAWKLATHEVSLRRRAEFTHALANGERTGAVWHTLEDLSAPPPGCLGVVPAWSQYLADVHTRLWPLGEHAARGLVNLGYAACDAALRRSDPSSPVAVAWPCPDVPLDVAR